MRCGSRILEGKSRAKRAVKPWLWLRHSVPVSEQSMWVLRLTMHCPSTTIPYSHFQDSGKAMRQYLAVIGLTNGTWISGLALALGLIAAAPTASGAQTCSVATFCGGWRGLCIRKGVVGEAVCQKRYAACLSSRCFHFDNPRPRCMSNPGDMALTTACQRR